MDARLLTIAAIADTQHSVVSLSQVDQAGVDRRLRSKWVEAGLLERLGPRSFALAGSAPSWMRSVTASWCDLDGVGAIAGRSAGRLMGLDGFTGDEVELLAPRCHRNRVTSGLLRTTSRPITRFDVQMIDGLRVVRAERLILDAPIFHFTRNEIEHAIDSAIRLRLVSEQRLRTRAVSLHRPPVNGSRSLLDAMVDSGGESRLERWFLRLCREAGIPRPMLQKTYRADGRTIARVDFEFPGGLVVEVAGHGTHASRQQLRRDAERQVELTLRGKRVLTFTYEHVRDQPAWVVSRLRVAGVAPA